MNYTLKLNEMYHRGEITAEEYIYKLFKNEDGDRNRLETEKRFNETLSRMKSKSAIK